MIPSSRQHWRLCLAVTGSLLLHSLLLFNMARQPTTLSSARQQTPISAYLVERKVVPSTTQPAIDSTAISATNEHTAKVDPAPATQGVAATAAVPPRVAASSSPAGALGKSTPRLPLGDASAPGASGYRPASDLDPPPQPLGEIELEYPPDAGRQQGTVVLRLLISDAGNVDDAIVVSADPPGVFDAVAVAAFKAARFSPGRYLGLPVRSQISIAVDYTPTNRGSAVSGQGGFDAAR